MEYGFRGDGRKGVDGSLHRISKVMYPLSIQCGRKAII